MPSIQVESYLLGRVCRGCLEEENIYVGNFLKRYNIKVDILLEEGIRVRIGVENFDGVFCVDDDRDLGPFLLIHLFLLVEDQIGFPIIPFIKYSQSIGMKDTVGTYLGLWCRLGGYYFCG